LSGILNASNLEKALHLLGEGSFNSKETQFYICGPAEMIDSIEQTLGTAGVPLAHIESEKFQYDFAQKNARNRLSLILMGLASSALCLSAIYLAK
jgi:ferredoxin-NADP reductase